MSLFEIESEHFGGEVKVIRPPAFPDNRGTFVLTYLEDEYKAMGLPKFVRSMHTHSGENVLRGLHYQTNPAMGKLIQVVNGRAFMVAVDVRPDSPTFLKYHSVVADDCNNLQVWAPSGFARGYYTMASDTIVQYNCDEYVGADKAILWSDPDIGISWPITGEPILSERDANARTVKESWASFWREQ